MSGVAETGGQADEGRVKWRLSRSLTLVIGTVAAVVVALFALLALLHEEWGVDVRVLLRDPAETADIPEYAGAYMYAGVLVLWTAGVMVLGMGFLLRARYVDPRQWRFFAGLGAFLCWLAADDLFMIHEWLGLALSRSIGVENEYLGRTRLEGVVFVAYGVVAVAWTWRQRAILARSGPALFAIAVACFGLSAVVDIGGSLLDDVFETGQVLESVRAYAEEMLKFAGMLFMLAYVLLLARGVLRGM